MRDRAMTTPWPWPWKPPMTIYDDNGPATPIEFVYQGIPVRVSPTSERGITTGRRRFKSECLACNLVLHEASTGGHPWIEQHVREAHK